MNDTNDRNGRNDRDSAAVRPGSNIEPTLGNTLDFYNDDMSRKAVGRLFAPNDDAASSSAESSHGEPPTESSGLVQGFESERRSASDERYPMEETYPQNPADDEAELPSLRRKRGGAISQAASNNQEPLDESDYGFNLYRKKQPLDRQHLESEHESASRLGARRKARTSADYDEHGPLHDDADPPPRPANKVYKKIEPQRDFDQKPDPFPPRRAKPPARAPVRKPRFAIHRDEEDDDDMDDDHERQMPSMRTIVLGGSIFAVVLVVAIVVFQLFSLSSRLTAAEEEAALSSSRQLDINRLTIENNDLQSQLNSALAEVSRLEGLFQAGGGVGGTPPSDQNEEPTGPTPPVRSHTVQPGQTLSSIGQIFFPGDPNAWMRIAEANGINPPHHIQIGQNLIIPD